MGRKIEYTVDWKTLYYHDEVGRIDLRKYTQFYPEKIKAIRELRVDTDCYLGLKEAKEIADGLFELIETGKVEIMKVPDKDTTYIQSSQYNTESYSRHKPSEIHQRKDIGTGGCMVVFLSMVVMAGIIFITGVVLLLLFLA